MSSTLGNGFISVLYLQSPIKTEAKIFSSIFLFLQQTEPFVVTKAN